MRKVFNNKRWLTLLAGLWCLTCTTAMAEATAQNTSQKKPQKLSFTIDRTMQGLDNARYVIDLRQWPDSVTSWCEGEKLNDLPFCGGVVEDDQTRPIKKTVTFVEGKLFAAKVVENQNNKVLRSHRVDYAPDHKRIKAKLKSKAANGATLAKANIISDQPIGLITLEAMLLNRISSTPFNDSDNLHWLEPKRSKRMKWQPRGKNKTTLTGNYPVVQASKVKVYHVNPFNGKQVAMFDVYFNAQGWPLQVQAKSGKWKMGLDKLNGADKVQEVSQLWQ